MKSSRQFLSWKKENLRIYDTIQSFPVVGPDSALPGSQIVTHIHISVSFFPSCCCVLAQGSLGGDAGGGKKG